VEGVPKNGFAASREAASSLEPRREKRENDTLRCACSERWLRGGDGSEERQVSAGTLALSSLRNLALNLRDDRLSLSEPIEMMRYVAQLVARDQMKAAIAPRSWYQLRGAGWRWRRRG
jgi:hypothetical protein